MKMIAVIQERAPISSATREHMIRLFSDGLNKWLSDAERKCALIFMPKEAGIEFLILDDDGKRQAMDRPFKVSVRYEDKDGNPVTKPSFTMIDPANGPT